jgi:hypothetical protein
MSISTIILNSKNVVPNTNNTSYKYSFPTPTEFKNKSIAIHSINMYNSIFNVNKELYNNDFFQYQWWNSSGVLTAYDVVLSDGNYSVVDINYALQGVMLNNKHYIYDSNQKKNIFFIEITDNITEYAFEINLTPMPTTLTAYQIHPNPTGWILPTTQQTPRIIFPSTSNFRNLVGFNSGIYPSSPSNVLYRKLSDFVPMIDPVSSIIVRCDACRNMLSNPYDVLYSFTLSDVSFGGLLNERPQNLIFVDMLDRVYDSIVITFVDQNFNPIHILDSQLIINLIIMNKI